MTPIPEIRLKSPLVRLIAAWCGEVVTRVAISGPLEVFERETRILKYSQKQASWQVPPTMHRHDQHRACGMLQDQMRARLAHFPVALEAEKSQQLTSGRHLFDRNGDRFGVYGSGCGNWAAGLFALENVDPDCIENAGLGLFDGRAETVYARQVLAVSVVLLAVFLDGNWVSVVGHLAARERLVNASYFTPFQQHFAREVVLPQRYGCVRRETRNAGTWPPPEVTFAKPVALRRVRKPDILPR